MDKLDVMKTILKKAAVREEGKWFFGAVAQEDGEIAAGVIRVFPEGTVLAYEYFVEGEPVRDLSIFIKNPGREREVLHGRTQVGSMETFLLHFMFNTASYLETQGLEEVPMNCEVDGMWVPQGNLTEALMPLVAAPMTNWELTVRDDGTQLLLGTHSTTNFRMCLIRKPGEEFGAFYFSEGEEAVDSDETPVPANQVSSDAVHQMWVAYNKRSGKGLEV